MAPSTAVQRPSPAWEATVLVRDRPRRAPRVARTLRFPAVSAEQARAAAAHEIACLRDEGGVLSLGSLRPLVPGLPGAHRYEVVFAEWVEDQDGYRRRDVLTVRVWATDAVSARSFATQEAECEPAYRGAWRVRHARRIPAGS
ncbi:MAG: hypothetical protein U0237_17210 [Thermoleophilia bacterium]